MKSADNIKKSIKELNLTAPPELHDRVLGSLVKTMEQFNQQPSAVIKPSIWRIAMKDRITKLAAAAAIIIAVLICINHFSGPIDVATPAFADVIEQIEKAKTITWNLTFYSQVTSKDGERIWVETETRQLAYKAPGLYREVRVDDNGQITNVTIEDAVNLKELSLDPVTKYATLLQRTVKHYDPRGAFSWEKEYIKGENKGRSLEWVGQKNTTSGTVNVFRSAFRDEANNQDWSYDFWVSKETKQLIAVYVPGADIYDPEKDPARNNPSEKDWSRREPMCHVKDDIVYNAQMDESLFSLSPPPGYSVEVKRRREVTEKEMIEYLGILAEYYDNSFPSQAFPHVTSDELNQIEEQPPEDRTAVEQKLVETIRYYIMNDLNMMPLAHFIEDHTVEKTFRYLGKGVTLGDKDRIVCWYQLKGSSTYRAVYGDLSVQDVTREDLPLP